MDFQKIKYKIQDHMLLGSVYDNVMLKTKYRLPELSWRYNVMMGQKHRMLYYKEFRRKYYERCTQRRDWEKLEKTGNPDTVWILWMQGMEQAPEIVKVCVESVKKQLPDKHIILLSEQNFSEYVTMPEDILRKWKEGIIGTAHFSDLLRLEILIKYGGFWIDSTVLCTDNRIFQYAVKEPLFMYSFYYFGFTPEIMSLNNWFIYSYSNQNILCLMREFLYEYWKEQDHVKNYFIFQIFMTLATEFYKEEFTRMPILSQADPHILASYIDMPFDQNRYELLKLHTGIHKLSTRFDQEKLTEGTFYDEVIRRRNY